MLIPSQVQYSIYKEVWSGRNATCSAYLWSQHQHRRHTPDKNIIAIDIVKRSTFKSDIRRMKVDLFQCGTGRKTCGKEAIQVLQQLTNMCVAGGRGLQLWRTVILSEKVGFWNTLQASYSTVELVPLGMLAEGYSTVTESYILFCLQCYRLSVHTDSAVFNSKLCIILIWFVDCWEHVSFVARLLSVCEVS